MGRSRVRSGAVGASRGGGAESARGGRVRSVVRVWLWRVGLAQQWTTVRLSMPNFACGSLCFVAPRDMGRAAKAADRLPSQRKRAAPAEIEQEQQQQQQAIENEYHARKKINQE
eukprot:4424406-Prymnesium_polylepis.1